MTDDAPRPTVWTWFVAYASAMAALYLLVSLLGVVFFVLPAETLEMDPVEKILNGVFMTAIGLPLSAVFIAAPFLPRKPWAWIYDLILIAIGMTSCCCLPATIPLLIYWLKPEAKRFFGRTD